MIIRCPNCGFEHDVPDHVLEGKERAKLRCAKCREVFVYESPSLRSASLTPLHEEKGSGLGLYLNVFVFLFLSAVLCACFYLKAKGKWPFVRKPVVVVSSVNPFFVSTLSGDVLALHGSVESRYHKTLENLVFGVKIYNKEDRVLKSFSVCPGGLPSEEDVELMTVDDLKDAVFSSCFGAPPFTLQPDEKRSFFIPVPLDLSKAAYYSVSLYAKK